MAAKKRKAAAPASHQHQLESDYLSPAQKKVFARPTPRVATVASSAATAKQAKKASAKKSVAKASSRKRAAVKKTAAMPAAAEK